MGAVVIGQYSILWKELINAKHFLQHLLPILLCKLIIANIFNLSLTHQVYSHRVAGTLLQVAGGPVSTAVRAVLATHCRWHRAAAESTILQGVQIIRVCSRVCFVRILSLLSFEILHA